MTSFPVPSSLGLSLEAASRAACTLLPPQVPADPGRGGPRGWGAPLHWPTAQEGPRPWCRAQVCGCAGRVCVWTRARTGGKGRCVPPLHAGRLGDPWHGSRTRPTTAPATQQPASSLDALPGDAHLLLTTTAPTTAAGGTSSRKPSPDAAARVCTRVSCFLHPPRRSAPEQGALPPSFPEATEQSATSEGALPPSAWAERGVPGSHRPATRRGCDVPEPRRWPRVEVAWGRVWTSVQNPRPLPN